MLVLSDMDGVIADFDAHLMSLLAQRHPELVPATAPDERREFELSSCYPENQDAVHEVMHSPGFFATMPMVPGAREGLAALEAAGHTVMLCTAPLSGSLYCAAEKLTWVQEQLGADWRRRTLVVKDKTLVRGDILIDDKPEVTGALEPTWTHVRYRRSYNAHLPGPSMRWEDPEVLTALQPVPF